MCFCRHILNFARRPDRRTRGEGGGLARSSCARPPPPPPPPPPARMLVLKSAQRSTMPKYRHTRRAFKVGQFPF